jgi:ABC-2 type transport system permease protein
MGTFKNFMDAIDWKNPILVKDIRTRMRGYRAFILITAHLLILSLVLGVIFLLFKSFPTAPSPLENQRQLSKIFFGILVWMELVVVCFIAPALTSGAISMERERHTYDLLRVTLLSPRTLVLGKFLAALTFVFLLLFTSIPMQSPAFIIGGVLPQEIWISILVLSIGATAYCAIGLFFSSLTHRTILATVLSYACAVFLMYGIPVIALAILIVLGIAPTSLIQNLSPSAFRIWLIVVWLIIAISPLASLAVTEGFLLDQQTTWLVSIQNGDMTTYLISPWVVTVLIYSILTIVLVWTSIQIARQVDNQ